MNLGRASITGIATAWAIGIVFWPLAMNREQARDSRATVSGQQSLYQSTLTTAGFGLLGVKFYESNENAKRWNVRSDFAELHRKENYAFLKKVDAEFFASHTGNVVDTDSDYGHSYLDRNQIDLEGDVSIRSKRGYLFTMDRLTYRGDKHFFESKDVVTMKGPLPEKPAMTLRGTGLWADIDEEHFILKRKVSALRKLKTDQALRTTSTSGEFFTDQNRAIFRGNVKSQMPQIGIDSDELELTMVEDREAILATGHVLLKNKERIGHAQSAAIEVGGNRIVLEGKASIDSKGNQIRGERIVLYTDDDRIDVEQAEGRVQP